MRHPLLWHGTGDGRRTWSSPQWAAWTGQSEQDSAGFGWLDAICPEDRDRSVAAWRDADVLGSVVVDHRIRPASGDPVWFRDAAAPGNLPGEPPTWFGTSTPIDDVAAKMARQQALLEALQHRVRNTLGKIRAMARSTLRPGQPAADFAAGLDGRLAAIARIQAGLISNPLDGADLAQLVAGELATVAEQEGKRVSILGPTLRLQGRAAETFGLALHEMAMNAICHGALTISSGQIEVSWRVAGTGEQARLEFDWVETGQPVPLADPEHRGFGLHMLESALRFELGATTSVSFEPAGLHVTVELPLSRNVIAPGL